MSITTVPQPATIFPARSLGPINTMVVTEEHATDELEITQHPVQQGSMIADHAYVKPAVLSVKFVMGAERAPLHDLYRALLDLQAAREPFTVVTGKRQYVNMLFKSLSQTTDVHTERVLSITAQMQEVFITSVTIAAVPPRYRHTNPSKTGATENAGSKKPQVVKDKKKSILSTVRG